VFDLSSPPQQVGSFNLVQMDPHSGLTYPYVAQFTLSSIGVAKSNLGSFEKAKPKCV